MGTPQDTPEGPAPRVLVTGALGAIGVWTMRSLLDRGCDVVALDRGGARHRLPIALDEARQARITHVEADITDLAPLERVLDEHAITHVIHLAALQVPFVRADPVLGARVNVVGTANVLEAVRRRADRIGAARLRLVDRGLRAGRDARRRRRARDALRRLQARERGRRAALLRGLRRRRRSGCGRTRSSARAATRA